MALITTDSLRIVVRCSRLFSISSVSRDWEKQGKFMRKLLSERVERKMRETPRANQTFKVLDKKRTAVLNNLYMHNVTEALSFGGFSEIADKGIQITNVAVRNTGVVDVFWTASDNEDHVEIEGILSCIAGKVRNHLMYGSMMGNVPTIVFKRDISSIQMNDTMVGLNKISLELEVMKKTSLAADVALEPTEEIVPAAPLMRMDTLGLPHDKIYRRIKEASKNSYPVKVPVPPTTEEFNNILLGNNDTSESPEAQMQKKKELRRFINLYQKSALNSSTRKRNLQGRCDDIFYPEDAAEDYEECSS